MKTVDTTKEERYISPKMEILEITLQSYILDPSGNNNPTEPINPGEGPIGW